MADIRCPMCGKPNPASRDTCQHCQARLKPLIASSPGETQPPPAKPDLGGSSASGAGDWLSDFRADESEAATPEESDTSAASSDFGDWFSRLEEPTTSRPAGKQPSEEEALPDWLSDSPAPATPAAEQAAEPDWLHQFHTESTEETTLEPQKTYEDTGKIGAMDWLAGLSSFDTPAAEGTEPAAIEEELPDWMKPAGESGAFQSTGPKQQESFADWMHEVGGESAAEEPPEGKPGQEIDWSQAETTSGLSTGIPDWLAEASTPARGAFSEPQKTTSEPAAEAGGTDWFSKLGITSEEKEVGKPVTGAFLEATPAFVMGDEDMGAFVSGDEMTAAGTVEGDLESLPDWLAQMPAEQPAPTPEAPPRRAAAPPKPEPQAEADLAPAQLPTWLEAMRPVESAAPVTPSTEEGPSALETAGPLAGLRGILPVEADIARIRKPPVYSVKLQISEAHQARVSLLEELVASEGKTKPAVPHMAIAPQTVLRLVIALFLGLTVIGALWMGGGWTSLPDPQNAPQEMEDLRGQIEALSAGAPVLVAFDYDAGFSGEIEAAASAVIAHLIEKRTPLVFVSTNPTGPILAERLIKRQIDELNSPLLSNTNPYTTSLFTNLGYIPGGIAGLRAFANTPAQVLPIALDGQDIWNTAPLTTSSTLASFALALVLADNPDTARAWIEQAGPALKPSPLLMVVSAQAEPLIRPYYDSGKVQGMVSGLAGGAAYENKRGVSGLASKSWDAFSAGLLVTTILLLIGGLVNASLASMARNKQKGEEQPYA